MHLHKYMILPPYSGRRRTIVMTSPPVDWVQVRITQSMSTTRQRLPLRNVFLHRAVNRTYDRVRLNHRATLVPLFPLWKKNRVYVKRHRFGVINLMIRTKIETLKVDCKIRRTDVVHRRRRSVYRARQAIFTFLLVRRR